MTASKYLNIVSAYMTEDNYFQNKTAQRFSQDGSDDAENAA